MGGRVTVSFDLDGTLTSNRFADSVWLEGLPRLVAESRGMDLEEARRYCLKAYETEGPASIRWYQLTYWLDAFGLSGKDPAALVESFCSRIELYDDALPVLEDLTSRGYPLVLFSNATRLFLNAEVRIAGLKPYFREVISVSDDWGMTKAQARAFERLRRLAGGEVVHVGDHLEFDCLVPRSVGLQAYHIARENPSRAEGSLGSLLEFVDRVTGARA
ncbi:MAG: HAD family hydrolase [Desulfomonilia bacterium]|jgi:FMN phosphatase YigB (HAD superfamily)